MTKKTMIKLGVFGTFLVGGVVALIALFRKRDLDYASPYFTLSEMFRSTIATKNGIDNTTTDENIIANIKALFKYVLDPARKQYGAKIQVTSGYRCPKVNTIAKGANSSQHMKGEAADLTTGTKAGNVVLYDIIRQNGNYDQLINENDYSWVHVSWKRDGINRRQELALKA